MNPNKLWAANRNIKLGNSADYFPLYVYCQPEMAALEFIRQLGVVEA